MAERELKYLRFPFRHKLISYVRDKDIRGVRKLSILLPKWLLPNPKKVGQHVLRTIEGVDLIINPSLDNGVELSLFQTGTYEKGILHFIKTNFNDNGCFVDVGSNIGLMSIFTAKHFPKSLVHSFEAHPETFDLLLRNIELNKLNNVEPHLIALGNETGETIIYDNWRVNRGGASLVVKSVESNSHSIKIGKLDNFLDSSVVPTMIKIDVEGFELEVLRGAVNIIKSHLPILIVEVSDMRENKHGSSSEIANFIKDLGPYKIFKLSGSKERKSNLVEILDASGIPEHDNIICIAEK